MRQVVVFNAHRTRRVKKRAASGYVNRVLSSAGVKEARVSVVFVGSRYCKMINRRYLGHNSVTDVISFPLGQGRLFEGEIYVNLDRAATQARQYRVGFNNEVARLVIHGTLHLVGYDDGTEEKAGVMKAVEDRHVRSWFH